MKRGAETTPFEYKNPTLLAQEILGVKHGPWKSDKRKLRDEALLSLLALTGLRISELLSLQKAQFDFVSDPDFILVKNIFVKKKKKKIVYNDIAIRRTGPYEPLVKRATEYLDTIKKGPIFSFTRSRAWQIVTELTGKWCHYFRSQRMSHLGRTLKGGVLSTAAIMKVDPATVKVYYKDDWEKHRDEL